MGGIDIYDHIKSAQILRQEQTLTDCLTLNMQNQEKNATFQTKEKSTYLDQ